MQIDVDTIRHNESAVGQIFWICDFRRDDLDKKAQRHVQPTKVMVRSNKETTKRIYYSEVHFVKVGVNGKVSTTPIMLFDNTGYRSDTGIPVFVFDNEEECIAKYNQQADKIIAAIDLRMQCILSSLAAEKQDILRLKMNSRT